MDNLPPTVNLQTIVPLCKRKNFKCAIILKKDGYGKHFSKGSQLVLVEGLSRQSQSAPSGEP